METKNITPDALKNILSERYGNIEGFNEDYLEKVSQDINKAFESSTTARIEDLGTFELKDTGGESKVVFTPFTDFEYPGGIRGRSLREAWKRRRGREKKEIASKLSKWAFYLVILIVILVIIILFDLV